MAKDQARLLRFFGKVGKDEDGNVLFYFTIMLPVIVGMIGLVLDGGAFLHLNTDLQELADAAALAGAKELDGGTATPNAIDRAKDKAENLLSNNPNWSNTSLHASGVQVLDPPIFYSSTPFVSANQTTDPTKAFYIQVTTVTRQRAPTFMPAVAAMLGGSAPSPNQTSASAIAGTTTVACKTQPLMLCNPYEGTSDFHADPGQLFHFKQKGSTGGFSPGDFGLLDPPGVNSSGAKTIRNLLSQQSPNFCYVDQVSPRPGQAVSDVADGINVRFDLTPNGNASGMDLTPAPNDIKGIMTDPTKAPACQNSKYNTDDQWPAPPSPPSPINTANTSNTAMYPGATDMTATPPTGILSIGSTMDMTAANAYWNYHHGTNWPAGTTRFQAYCQELGLGSDCQGTNSPPPWVANSEKNAPYCSTASTGDYKRRLINVAVVNCLANNVRGNSTANVRSSHYAVFFLVGPSPTSQPNPLNGYLGTSTNGDIMAEYVETVTPAGCTNDPSNPYCDGLHEIVQLYR
jgi:Flp pilus assembly protein TadG